MKYNYFHIKSTHTNFLAPKTSVRHNILYPQLYNNTYLNTFIRRKKVCEKRRIVGRFQYLCVEYNLKKQIYELFTTTFGDIPPYLSSRMDIFYLLLQYRLRSGDIYTSHSHGTNILGCIDNAHSHPMHRAIHLWNPPCRLPTTS